MEEIASNLNIPQAIVNYAKEVFSKYRDLREAVHKFEGTVGACLVIAYEDLASSYYKEVTSMLESFVFLSFLDLC